MFIIFKRRSIKEAPVRIQVLSVTTMAVTAETSTLLQLH